MVPHLQTPRLFLRPLELADAEQVQLLFPHWEIVRYLTAAIPWPYPPDGAHTFYRDVALSAMQRGDEWHWTLRLKTEPDQIIGGIDLRKRANENRGFWLGLPWHGQGLMTEACVAVTEFWFNTLKFPVLRAPKAVANAASRRISEKAACVLFSWKSVTLFADVCPLKSGRLRQKTGTRGASRRVESSKQISACVRFRTLIFKNGHLELPLLVPKLPSAPCNQLFPFPSTTATRLPI